MFEFLVNPATRLLLAAKALRELGPQQVGLYALYRFGLWSGHYRRMTPIGGKPSAWRPTPGSLRPVLDLPSRNSLLAVLGESASSVLAEAEEITAGSVRLFGGEPSPLALQPPGPLLHWTEYERGSRGAATKNVAWGQGSRGEDVKFIWEPARFGWAYTLGRAYLLSGEERYAQAFWDHAGTFWEANPVNLGPNWASAQEVALRLMALVFAAQAFSSAPASTTERLARLALSVAEHANRIPLTLPYSRSQNNNHLLVEAAGLYTAAAALPGHPQAAGWRALGWRWLNYALQTQIAEGGAYIQHSTNYHRLMLQAALWVRRVAEGQGQSFPPETCRRLAAAVHWLSALVDPGTGRLPNLGPNDGAYILPLSACPFSDYRPVVQAASQAFLVDPAFAPGAWDEMSLWLKVESSRLKEESQLSTFNLEPQDPLVLRSPHGDSWAYLRAARFTGRPGHADQLHLDLWWRGLNVAQDAGTYLYNAPPPWDNALARSAVHNTVTVDGLDQMTHAGRFLWLDWAQARVEATEQDPGGTWVRLAASHNGYRRLGLTHRREVTAYSDGRWVVFDQLLPVEGSRLRDKPVSFRLHWLLPDWYFRIENRDSRLEIGLESLEGRIRLRITCSNSYSLFSSLDSQIQLVRGGKLLHGAGPVSPTWGWTAPTYGIKIPALSLSVTVESPPPVLFTSEWLFPG